MSALEQLLLHALVANCLKFMNLQNKLLKDDRRGI